MRKILFIIGAWLALLGTNSCSKTEYDLYSTIYGTVVDAETGEPVPAAIVTLSPGSKNSVSGSDGFYEFTDLDIMQYTVMVQKEGYQTNRKIATAVSGERVRADITMTKIK